MSADRLRISPNIKLRGRGDNRTIRRVGASMPDVPWSSEVAEIFRWISVGAQTVPSSKGSDLAIDHLMAEGILEPKLPSAPSKTRVALVTTVKSPGRSFITFLQHHLKMGFSCIYVFFDDPNDIDMSLYPVMPGVSLIPCDRKTTRQWQDLHVFTAMNDFISSEVVARQVLNAELAVKMAIRDGCDWIVHMDSDEILCASCGIEDFLGRVDKTVGQVLFVNHEGVPEIERSANVFHDTTLFKYNPILCNDRDVDSWASRSGRQFFFHAYLNGKAAARLTPDLIPRGVHAFWHQNVDYETVDAFDPFIAHFPYCDIELYTTKYAILGPFADLYFASSPRLPFHIMSRDVMATKGAEGMRRLYQEEVIISEKHLSDVLLELQLGFRRNVIGAT